MRWKVNRAGVVVGLGWVGWGGAFGGFLLWVVGVSGSGGGGRGGGGGGKWREGDVRIGLSCCGLVEEVVMLFEDWGCCCGAADVGGNWGSLLWRGEAM